jgi:hypothetical protein
VSAVLAASGEPTAGAGECLSMPEDEFSALSTAPGCQRNPPGSIPLASSIASVQFTFRSRAPSGVLGLMRPLSRRTC